MAWIFLVLSLYAILCYLDHWLFFHNHGIQNHKNLVLKQFHVFGRGNVADALKSEKSQKETLRLHRPGWAFPSPCLLLLLSEGKISRGVNKNVVRTNRDRQWLQQSSILQEHWATCLGSEIKRHLKQDLGTQATVPELGIF